MTCQTLTQPATCPVFVVVEPEPISASSRDYGFDFDEDELGRELLTPLPDSLSTPSFPEVDADAFEKTFQYFLS